MSIVWLASYPKSGNTWVRAFLANYLSDNDAPVDINKMGKHSRLGISSSIQLLSEALGEDCSELSGNELEMLRPNIYEYLAQRCPSPPLFLKTHDSFSTLPSGKYLFPLFATKCAIYIIRNPLDVVLSMKAHFNQSSIEDTIQQMNSRMVIAEKYDRYFPQCRQIVDSWSDHVRSWTQSIEASKLCIIRYEDLIISPITTFMRVIDCSGLQIEEEKLLKAVQLASFEKLQNQERQNGFRERKSHDCI